MNSQARRVSALEAEGASDVLRTGILYVPGKETKAEALARHKARYGPAVGDPFFVGLVGVSPRARV